MGRGLEQPAPIPSRKLGFFFTDVENFFLVGAPGEIVVQKIFFHAVIAFETFVQSSAGFLPNRALGSSLSPETRFSTGFPGFAAWRLGSFGLSGPAAWCERFGRRRAFEPRGEGTRATGSAGSHRRSPHRWPAFAPGSHVAHWTRLSCTSFADRKSPPLERLVVEPTDRLLRLRVLAELDKGEPSWLSGFLVHWQVDRREKTDGGQMITQFRLGRIVRQVPYKKTHWHRHLTFRLCVEAIILRRRVGFCPGNEPGAITLMNDIDGGWSFDRE